MAGSSAASAQDDDEEESLSRHIHVRFANAFLEENVGGTPTTTATSSSSEQQLLQSTLPPFHFHGVDAYWGLSGISRIQLPTIFDWNNAMRKAYSFLFWIRPRIDEENNNVVVSNLQGCLYKFAHDSNSSGIIVYCGSEWVRLNNNKNDDDDDDDVAEDDDLIQTTLTALSGVSVVQLPLTLRLNAWHLVACTHVFPYLKRPQWTLTVNGQIVGSAELEYPSNLHVANDNVALQNMACGGIQEQAPTKVSEKKKGSAKSAPPADPSTTTTRKCLFLDVSSFALYPVAISATIQALAYEAGPTSVLNGRILPIIPSVANWNKGSSIEAGPKVGIPLIVHGAAPEIQRLATTVLVCFDAVHSVQLDAGNMSSTTSTSTSNTSTTGSSTTNNSRFLCPMIPQAGWSEKSPRVGLMQPGPPIRYEESSHDHPHSSHSSSGGAGGAPQCYVTGNVVFHHALIKYCQEQNISIVEENKQTQAAGVIAEYTSTLYWSVAMEDAVHFTVLPFFLALCPPGKFVERQEDLYLYSISRMYQLYHNNAQLAETCIDRLCSAILYGGGRVAESVLQNGFLHILATCLRLSLLRAQKAKFFTDPPKNQADWVRRFKRTVDESTVMPTVSGASSSSSSSSSSSPRNIPPNVVKACARLVAVCCGPKSTTTTLTSNLNNPMNSTPASASSSTSRSNGPEMWVVIRRTSDLALTALFALALDVDLWNADAEAAASIYETVADRYSDCGYVLRSQISVQFFLDCIVKRQLFYNEKVGEHMTRMLTAMLMASLSNKRSISQGEHDVAACVGALSDCPLSSLGAHVVLHAIANVLGWCEVLPETSPVSAATVSAMMNDHNDEQSKIQVASRLGRNMLISQFHDVVAPMVLSRTVFSGESIVTQQQQQQDNDDSVVSTQLSWESHWQLTLLLFSWVASIAGPEGLIASKSTGSLLLASALAGSLAGAMKTAEKDMISALYMPPPGMALMIGSTIRSEWSYTDLISDRLQIMMPLFPGLVVSLLSSPPQITTFSKQSLTVLAEILTSVGGAFHKVFGGTIHLTEGHKSAAKNRRDGSSESVKAAKSFVPYLTVVAVVFEKHLIQREKAKEENEAVAVYKPEVYRDKLKRIDLDSWVDIPSFSSESVVSELAVTLPSDDMESDSRSYRHAVSTVLLSCQKTVLNTAAGLLSNAMTLGGSFAAHSLWNTVLSSLEESGAYVSPDAVRDSSEKEQQLIESALKEGEVEGSADTPLQSPKGALAMNVLCRLIAIVLIKSLKRQDQWEVWSDELSSAVAKVCQLIEEKELLREPQGLGRLSDDQIVLFSAVLEILSYGRDATGWCQLALPAMTNSFSEDKPPSDLSAASKLLLPVLQSCLRAILSTIVSILSDVYIKIPGEEADGVSEFQKESLLQLTLCELDLSLTAAIVGLSFSGARDLALVAMATLRNAAAHHQEAGDLAAANGCKSLIRKVAEELRVRYEGERRLRENALFDAYNNDTQDATKDAIEGANVIERLILGDVLGSDMQQTRSEEISFQQQSPKRPGSVSDDFVLFHEPSGSTSHDKSARLGYAEYIGLGAALEECRMLASTAESEDESAEKVVVSLASYLDSWDAAAQSEANDSEVVAVFGSNFQSQTGTDGPTGTPNETNEPRPIAILGSETAADAMSAFFEFAAVEKSRMKEIYHRFLPSHRHSRMSYSERFCWARFMEVTSMDIDNLWERGIPDGNRDVRSRLPTLPCCPQFRRYIPRYLDHYAEPDVYEENPPQTDENARTRRSSVAGEMDAFTKTLLQAGNLEIVDITKKESAEEDEPDLTMLLPSGSIDEDDAALFTEATSDVGTDRYGRLDEQAKDGDEHGEPPTNEAPQSEDFTPSQAEESSATLAHEIIAKGQHSITTSAFSTPPDNASSSLSLLHSAAAGMIEQHMDNCLHVKPEGSRHCTVLLTATHLVLEYEGDPEGFFEGEVLAAQEDADRQRMIKEAGEYKEKSPDEVYNQKLERRQREIAALRPKSIRWNLSEVSHVYLRRYRLRDSSLEIFFIPTGGAAFGGFGLFAPSTSLFLDFGPGYEGNRRRDDAAFSIMQRVPQQAIKQWPDRSAQFLHDQLSRLTLGWAEGRITNFDYLLHLNMLSGRSYNDVCQYPVFPWVLADYTSEEIPDLTDRKSFRDLSKPVGALNPARLEDFIERFSTFADPSIPPFMYGSHYSTSAGVVLHFLVRLHPFAGLHRQLQSRNFDVADRLFSSVPRTWSMCTGTSAAEVKELTPEWYCNPSFLTNLNGFKLGTSQDGEVIGDVELPPWAQGSPEKFVEVLRAALESDICSEMLHEWVNLIFGRSQQGPEAVKANNVFFYLTYYGSVDVASIKDESLRLATELQIAHFGQCPMQLFKRPHVRRLSRSLHKLSFHQLISTYSQTTVSKASGGRTLPASNMRAVFGEPAYLPFFSAPLSQWVHLDAPPPGPHAALVAVRFAGTDRCLAVDAKGIFHTFRWAWRAEEENPDSPSEATNYDRGCFVAQRELPRFRSVPRLMHTQLSGQTPAVAISKTLFAGRSVLLVLSDGDGRGGLGMQLVDPSKGHIRGEVLIPAAHAGRITCIATDPIGTAAGHGGVGGELALFGSLDGSASLWRFMSSHYLPLRPRIRLRGNQGEKVSAVGLCSASYVAVTVSANKCCLYSIGNGTMLRSFGPPNNTIELPSGDDTEVTTKFADTPAVAVSVQGFLVTVCESLMRSKSGPGRTLVTLHLFTMEGVSLGSKPLEGWRGLPHKMYCTPDGTAIMVCCGRGITIHRLSAWMPLEIIDEWQITELDSLGSADSMEAAFDIDLGPSLNRPVVASAACSNGVLRLHALPGISSWSERHKTSGLSQTVGSALAKPAQRLNQAVREGIGLGRQLAGMGRDIGREVTSDVKERGIGGLLGNFISRKNSSLSGKKDQN